MDAKMDRMQKTLLLLFSLSNIGHAKTTFIEALASSTTLSVGTGYAHDASPGVFNDMQLNKVIGSQGISVPPILIRALAIESYSPYVSVELSTFFQPNLSGSIRMNIDKFESTIPQNLFTRHLSPQIETIARYHTNSVTYGIGMSLRQESLSYHIPLVRAYDKHSRFFPSLVLSSEIYWDKHHKIEISTALHAAEYSDDKHKNSNHYLDPLNWGVTSRIGLSYNF